MLRYRYTSDEVKNKFLQIIASNSRHDLYKSDVKIAEFWKKIITGENQDDILLQYRLSENDDMKEQRLRLTNTLTRLVVNRIKTTILEVHRCDSVSNDIGYTQGDKTKEQALFERLDCFSGDRSVREYLDEAFLMYNLMDPNAFLIVDFYPYDHLSERAYSYPSVARSEDVRWYEYYNNVLQFLIFDHSEKYTIRVNKKNEVKTAKVYYCYSKDLSWKLTENVGQEQPKGTDVEEIILDVTENQFKKIINKVRGKEDDPNFDGSKITLGDTSIKKPFFLEQFETNSEVVPAMKFGHVPNDSTYGANFESLLVAAKEVFTDLIWKKSTYDLHMALHGIAREYMYTFECDHEHEGKPCEGGYIGHGVDKKKCEVCHGTGERMLPRTEQHISSFKITIPKDIKSLMGEEVLPDMSRMHHYVQIPQHIIEMYESAVDKFEGKIASAIFNVNIFDQQQLVPQTATEITARISPKNNVLSSYASKLGIMIMFTRARVANYADLLEGLANRLRFPADFKLETLNELLSMRKAAVDSGSPYSVLSNIDRRILAKQNIDDPERLALIEARGSWRPFADKPKEQAIAIVSIMPQLHPKKVLYNCFDDIFREIENLPKYKSFATLKYEKQKEIIDELIEKYAATFESDADEEDFTIDVPELEDAEVTE